MRQRNAPVPYSTEALGWLDGFAWSLATEFFPPSQGCRRIYEPVYFGRLQDRKFHRGAGHPSHGNDHWLTARRNTRRHREVDLRHACHPRRDPDK